MVYRNANRKISREKYGYNIKELTKDFSFFDFTHSVQIGDVEYNGGILVCTPKQYILSYNLGFGSASHNATFARVEKDLHGGGSILIEDELGLCEKCRNKYIHAKILYGRVDPLNYSFKGFIDFYIPDKISPKSFESFKEFFKDFASEISLVNRNVQNFSINYCIYSRGKYFFNSNMEEIYNCLQSVVDYNLDDEESEYIIGKDTKNKVLRFRSLL